MLRRLFVIALAAVLCTVLPLADARAQEDARVQMARDRERGSEQKRGHRRDHPRSIPEFDPAAAGAIAAVVAGGGLLVARRRKK